MWCNNRSHSCIGTELHPACTNPQRPRWHRPRSPLRCEPSPAWWRHQPVPDGHGLVHHDPHETHLRRGRENCQFIMQMLEFLVTKIALLFVAMIFLMWKKSILKPKCDCPDMQHPPARKRTCEFLFSGTLSERSHGCIPRKLMMLPTASVHENHWLVTDIYVTSLETTTWKKHT